MIHHAVSELILDRLAPDAAVLDVGGGRFPWFRATHIIDRRPYDNMVRPIAFAGRTGENQRFTPDTWTARDFYDLPWPFDDQQFDFSLCMGTLEDLHDPFTIAAEIQRVSKAGYVSTPTRAAESTRGVSRHPDTNQLFGYVHHRWFVEIEHGALVFTDKNPMLHQHPQHAVDDFQQHTLNFFWEHELPTRQRALPGIAPILDDLARFAREHRLWLDDCAHNPTDRNDRYNRWPAHWGDRPRFLELPGVTGVHPADALPAAAAT